MGELNNRVKRLDVADIALVKLAVAAGVLFVVAQWPAVMNLVLSVNPWCFLVAFVIFAVRPTYKFWSK